MRKELLTELAELRLEKSCTFSINLRDFASLFTLHESCFLLAPEDGAYLKNGFSSIFKQSNHLFNNYGVKLDMEEFIARPQDVFNCRGRLIIRGDDLLKWKKNRPTDKDLLLISAVKLMEYRAIDYIQQQVNTEVGQINTKPSLNNILNEGGIMCYNANEFSDYFFSMEEQLSKIINRDYYSCYCTRIVGSTLVIEKSLDIRLEEWYKNKLETL